MNTVRDYQDKGVVFVEGDIVKSADPISCFTQERFLSGHYDDCRVTSFAWRTMTTKLPVLHSMSLDMLIEVDYYYTHANFGREVTTVNHLKWGQPTVHKAWRPIAQQYQLTVRVGAELYWNGDLVEVMAISNGTVCVKQEDGELDLVQDANNLKSAEHHERVTDLCHVLRTSHDTVTDACTALGQYKTYAEAILKAGYRKG